MTPRNTQLGATASVARAIPLRTPRVASASGVSTSATRNVSGSAKTRRPAVRKPTEPTAHRWWLLPLVVIAVIAFLFAAYYPVARVQYRETRQRARLQSELDALRARNDRLRTQVARLRTPEGVEDYARLQMGFVKAGEHQIVVVDGTEPVAPLASQAPVRIDSQEAVKPPVGPWTAFLDAVFSVQ